MAAKVCFEEVLLSAMDFVEEEDTFYYDCECGDRFLIGLDELLDGEDIADCPSCSLLLRVTDVDECLNAMEAAAEAAEAAADAAPVSAPAASKHDSSTASILGQSSAATLLAKGVVDAMISASVDQSVLQNGLQQISVAAE